MTEEFEDMIEEVEDEVVEESQSSADPINTEEVVEEDELIVTDEMLDTIADTAIAALQDILQYFNVGEVTIDEYEGDEGELILDISGKDMAVLIGRHGKTLDALQFIVSMITVRTIGFRYPVIVDVEGYKNRQRQKLESIAHSSANRAASQHRKVGLRPMTPYERRIIHIALRDDDRVETVSEGEVLPAMWSWFLCKNCSNTFNVLMGRAKHVPFPLLWTRSPMERS